MNWRRRSTRDCPTTTEVSKPAGGKPYYHIPAFTRHDDRLFIRYIPQFVLASQRHDTTPRLTETQLAAMKAYSALVDDPDHWVPDALRAGRHAVREQLSRAAMVAENTSMTPRAVGCAG